MGLVPIDASLENRNHAENIIPIRGLIDKFAENYGSLIITVDCGISNNEEIAYAAEKGIDVIVTDHHRNGETLPDAVAVIDPICPECSYPFKYLCGAGVAFKLVQALAETVGLEDEVNEYLDKGWTVKSVNMAATKEYTTAIFVLEKK